MSSSTESFRRTPGSSPDFQSEYASQLSSLFPEAIVDGKLDISKIRELLGEDAADESERFGLFWPGKHNALRAAQLPTTATLVPQPEFSKNWDGTKNVFIEGDNLEVLKILQKHYHGKIKVIYIDPPYNTGQDFIYPDNFGEGLESYLEWTRQINQEGKKVSTNSESEGRFHSNWLNMIYPRLKLARNLLTQDGVIFISIGREEVQNLTSVCNQIFGEQNVITVFSREQKSGSNQGDYVAPQLDFIVACARSRESLKPFVLSNKELERDNEKSLFQSSLDPLRGCVNQRYWMEAPDGSFIIPPGENFPEIIKDGSHIPPKSRNDKVWRWSWASYLAQKDQLRFKDTGRGTLLDQNGQPSKWNVYTVKSNLDSDMRPRDYIFGLTNSAGTAELNALGLEGLFDNPKPTELIQFLISIVQDTSDAIILDFFAGSGTTGHAVMALNAIDGGTRQVIQVQLPEPTSEDSDARREGYLTISDLTRKRLNAAGDSLQSTLSGQAVDVGYRSYRLSDTNFSKWRVESSIAANKLEEHLLSLRDSFSENRSSDALLIEILLKQGYSLSEKFRDINVDNLQIKSISDNIILAYLDNAIKPTLMQIRKILDLKPMRFIILDDSLQGDDELKTNLVQECKSSNVELWTA